MQAAAAVVVLTGEDMRRYAQRPGQAVGIVLYTCSRYRSVEKLHPRVRKPSDIFA